MGGPYAGWTIKSQCATYRVLSGTGNLLIRGHVLAIAIPRIVQQDSSGNSVNQSVFIKYSKNIMANTTVCIACCYNHRNQELQVWYSHSVPKSGEPVCPGEQRGSSLWFQRDASTLPSYNNAVWAAMSPNVKE